MNIEQLVQVVGEFEGVLDLAPREGSEAPEIAWGDHFFYYAPDGVTPTNAQPYATVVTKDYPDDRLSGLDEPGRWRVNIHVGTTRFADLIGESPRVFAPRDYRVADVVLPHPVYGALGWVSVVNPGAATRTTVLSLLRDAHDDARRRAERRSVEWPARAGYRNPQLSTHPRAGG